MTSTALMIASAPVGYGIWKHGLFIPTLAMVTEDILSAIPNLLLLINPEGTISTTNQAALEFLGYHESELIGQPLEMIVAEEDWEEAIAPGKDLNNLVKTGPINSVETTFKTKDGGTIPVLLSVSAVRDRTGKLQGWACVGSDLTERKRAERLLRALNQAAQSMEQALTPEEIFATVAEELEKLGFSCLVFLTDNSQEKLFLRYWSYETRAIRSVETLVSFQRKDFPIFIETADEYRRVVWERETVFMKDVEEVMRQLLPPALPGPVKRLAIARMLRVSKAITAPLMVGDKVIGTLSVQSEDLTEDDIPAITAFAYQMAAAWRKVMLLQDLKSSLAEHMRMAVEMQWRVDQAVLTYEVGRRVSSELELEALLSEVVTAIYDAFDYSSAALLLLDEEADCLTLQSIAGDHVDTLPKDLRLATGEGMIGYAAATGETQVSSNVSQSPHYVRKSERETNSELAVPIKSGQKVIGVLDLQSDEFDAFDETDMMMVETLANQVATAIENARLYEAVQRELTERKRAEGGLHRAHDELEIRVQERTVELARANESLRAEIAERKQVEGELEQRAAQLALLNDIGGKIAAVIELDSVLDRAARLVQENFGYHRVSLFTLDRERGELVMRATAGDSAHLFPPDHRLKLKQGIVGWVGYYGKKLLANDVDAVPHYVNLYPNVIPTRSELSVPIGVGGEIVGVLDAQSPQPNAFDEDDVKVMEILADQIAIAIDNARLYEAIQHELAERKRAEESLQKAHAQNQQLLVSISSILIGVGPDDRITHWNAPAETAFGIAAADVIGQPFVECSIQWDWTEITDRIAHCRRENRPVQLRDIRYTRPDEKDGVLDITVTPFIGEDSTQPGFLLLGEVITERKILEMQLAQAQKLKAVGQLAAGIAHEINTPIQYVTDNTRFVQESFADVCGLLGKYHHLLGAAKAGPVSPELVAEVESAAEKVDVGYLSEEITVAIQESLEGVTRVTEIVQAMRGFSHPGVEEKTSIDINKAIEGAITVARNEWKNVAEMETDFDINLPLVPCLPGEFNQVILNVLVNAAHAIADAVGNGAKAKGPALSLSKGTITVSTCRDDDWAEIRISDTGMGIPEEVQPRIFEPFFTTKDVGRGTGQGLAIAHNVVVDKHGGTIALETEVGKGTTFIIRLPIGDGTG